MSVFLIQLIALGIIYPYIKMDMSAEERTAIKAGIAIAIVILLIILWGIVDYLLKNSPVFQ